MTPEPIPSTGPRPRTEAKYDWHDSECGGMEATGFDGEPLIVPCDCEMPRLFRTAHGNGRREALAAVEEAVRAEQGWPVYADEDGGASTTGNLIDRAAVLAVLAKLQEDEQ